MKFFRDVTTNLRRNRSEHPSANSVADYKSRKALQKAMMRNKRERIGNGREKLSLADNTGHSDGESTSNAAHSTNDEVTVATEWELTLYDKEKSEPQTMDSEMKRLRVLQSYHILDSSDSDQEFDTVTVIAKKIFKTEVAIISLIDLGRQWFLSRQGTDVKETPRNISFCSHVIISKAKLMVVGDLLADFRFKENPLVVDGPKVRFYAGAALITPEGYNLGTLCILSTTPRPAGLARSEMETLQEMSSIVVDKLVARRDRFLKSDLEEKVKDLGRNFADVANTLDTMGQNNSAIKHSTLGLHAMCQAAARTALEDDPANKPPTKQEELEQSKKGNGGDWDDEFARLEDILDPSTNVSQLFENVDTFIASFSKTVPVTMELSEDVPLDIVGEDLLLFRSAINLVTNGISQTTSPGSEVFFKIRKSQGEELVFECQGEGNSADRENERTNPSFMMRSIKSMVRSMDGKFGTRVGRLDGKEGAPSTILWFSVPATTPDVVLMNLGVDDDEVPTVQAKRTVHLPHKAKKAIVDESGQPIIRNDPFQSAWC